MVVMSLSSKRRLSCVEKRPWCRSVAPVYSVCQANRPVPPLRPPPCWPSEFDQSVRSAAGGCWVPHRRLWLGWRAEAVGNCCCMGLSIRRSRCLPGPPSGMNSLVVLRCRLTLIRWSSDLRRAVRESRTPDVDECPAASGSVPGALQFRGCRSPKDSSASGARPVLLFPRA